MSWSQKMSEARQMKSEGMALLYERVNILVGIYHDREFQEYCRENGKDGIAMLDLEVDDTGDQEFLLLMAVLEHFPRKEQWQGGRLKEMKAEVLSYQKAGRQERKPEAKRVEWRKEYEELLERYHNLEKEHARVLGKLEALESRLVAA